MMLGPFHDRSRSVAKQFGRKRVWCLHHIFRLLHKLGALRHLEAVDWQRVERLVFVCKGNICRSPYAEARARAFGWNAASFGLYANGSRPADPTAVRIARCRGIDLSTHYSRPITVFLPSSGDLLIGMEPAHAKRLLGFSKICGAQVTLLGLWASELWPHIEDPHGLSDEHFDTCFTLIDSAVERIAACMRSR